jgi:hypothetical protein
VEVALACVHAEGVELEEKGSQNHVIVLPAYGDSLHAVVGRQHQPSLFEHLVPDVSKLMNISRTHFELSWSFKEGTLWLRKLSANPLSLNDELLQTGALVPVPAEAIVSFVSLADSSKFLTFRVHINGQFHGYARCPGPSRVSSHTLISAAHRCTAAVLECTFASGSKIAQLPSHARNLSLDLRHRAVIGRQSQPGFFENLLQGAPHLATFISRAHLEVVCTESSGSVVEVGNLSQNAILVDGRLIAKGQRDYWLEGGVLTFTGHYGQSGDDKDAIHVVEILHLVLRRP